MTLSAPVAPRPRFLPPLPPLPRVPTWQIALGAGLGLAVAVLSGRPILAILLVFGVPYAFVTSLRTKVLGYFVVLPLIGGVRYQLPDAGVQVLPDFMALAILVQLGLQLATNRITLPIRHPLVILAFAYALIAFIQSMTPLARATGVGGPGLVLYLQPFVLFVAGLVFWSDRDAPRLFFRVGVIAALFVGLYMLKQLIFGFSAAEIAFQEGRLNVLALNEQKLFSTLSGAGVYAFVTVLFALVCLAARVTGATPRRLTLCAGALSAIGIVVSGARIALIGAVPAIAMMLALIGTSPGGRSFARRTAALGLALAIVLAAVIAVTPVQDRREIGKGNNPLSVAVARLALLKAGSEDQDIASRQERLGLFTNYISRHPWGAGSGAVGIVRDAGPPQVGTLRLEPQLPPLLRGEPWIFQGDFYYFSIGVELGIFALMLFLALFIGGIMFALGARRGELDPTKRMVLAVAATGLLFAMVHNLTNESFRSPQVSSYAWFLLAAPIVLGRRTDADVTTTSEAVSPSG